MAVEMAQAEIEVTMTGSAVRAEALKLAVQHVDTHDSGYAAGGTVLAFAEVFAKFIETGETEVGK